MGSFGVRTCGSELFHDLRFIMGTRRIAKSQ
jgi:hypothetical protein